MKKRKGRIDVEKNPNIFRDDRKQSVGQSHLWLKIYIGRLK
jgi:hypothetical protein